MVIEQFYVFTYIYISCDDLRRCAKTLSHCLIFTHAAATPRRHYRCFITPFTSLFTRIIICHYLLAIAIIIACHSHTLYFILLLHIVIIWLMR